MTKRFRSKLVFTPEHPEADPRHVVRGVVRFGLRPLVTLTAEQRAELDRRLDAYEADGDAARPADEVIAEIRRSLGLRNKAK